MARIVSRARTGIRFWFALVALAVAGTLPASAVQELGDQVPNLVAAGGCDGLCHVDGYPGSAATNPLNLAFEAAGFVWNATVANADSDNDGFSNGWEVQDPSGTWVSGTPYPGSAARVSNPTLPLSLPPLPVAISPAAITHAEAAGQNGSEGFDVQNVGAVPFDYSITPSDLWMTPNPAAAQALPANEQDAILLMFATGGLIDGLYQGDLAISIPGIRADRIALVDVDLTVPEPGAVAAGAGALLGLGLLARRGAGRLRATTG